MTTHVHSCVLHYNEQSVATVANNRQTSSNVSIDALFSKPNKQRKPANASQDYEYVYGHGTAGGGGNAVACIYIYADI